jgi:hypothetical protein
MKRLSPTARAAFALLALLVLGGTAAAGELVPFKGDLDATVERTPVPGEPLVLVEVDGGGKAAHLGRFTFEAPHYVNTATRTAAGTYTFTAANGDTLTADFTGTATPVPGSSLLYIVETATITGGTGRFADATGSFTVERLYDPVDGTTTGSFEGTLSSAGAPND